VQDYLLATTRREIAHAPVERIESDDNTDDAAPLPLEGSNRYGDRRALLVGAELLPPREIRPGDRVVLRVRFQVLEAVSSLIAGFLVRNSRGENIFGSNTARENYPVPVLPRGHTVEFHWTMPELPAAHYTVSLGIADGDIEHWELNDYMDDAISFELISGNTAQRGLFKLRSIAVTLHEHGKIVA
jgi:hypothetical protein